MIYPDSLIVICGVIIIIYHQEGHNYVTAYDLRNENMQFAVLHVVPGIQMFFDIFLYFVTDLYVV